MSEKTRSEANEENANNVAIDQVAATAVIWLDKQSVQERWDLSDEQICILLGGITTSTWTQWKKIANKTESLELEYVTLKKIAFLISIDKMIEMSAPFGHEYDFFKRPINHPLFNNLTAKEYLLKNNTIDDLYEVRNHFRSRVLI